MKKVLLFLIVFNPVFTNAQRFEEDDSLFTPTAEKVEYVTENLNFSEATTGYLFDRGLPLLDFTSYNSTTLTDSNLSNSFSFAFGYAALSSMALYEASLLPHPDSSYGNTIRSYPNPEDVLIAGLHFEYNRLATGAIVSGHLTPMSNYL